MAKRFAAILFVLLAMTTLPAQKVGPHAAKNAVRPEGPCDLYAAAGDPCVAAHSTTRALYRTYTGPLYQVLRQTDGRTLDIPVARSVGSSPGGYADAPLQDTFCKNTVCWISKVYDQSPKHNDLTQAPRGGFSGPAMGGMNNLPLADMAPVSIMGHKVYGVFIEPGMGLRIDDPRGTAVDDQAEGQYWVINGRHFNSGCCFDYGNAEIDSRDDDNGTMETAYFGDNTGWIHGNPPGPWIETDQENNLVGCVPDDPNTRLCPHLPDIHYRFVTAIAKGKPHHWTSMGGDSQSGDLSVMFDGRRVNSSYDPMRKQGAILLGNGGDNSNSSQGTFYEGAVTASGTFPTDATDQAVQANIVSAGYRVQPLSITPASSKRPTGVQTFALGASKDLTVEYTNITNTPVHGVELRLAVPLTWRSVVQGTVDVSKHFSTSIAPGESVSATFTVSAGSSAYNGDIHAIASTARDRGAAYNESVAQRVRSSAAIKINEFRVSSANSTDSFIELYNAGTAPVDLSKWTLTVRPAEQPSFSSIQLPAGAKLKPKSFYLLGLSNSALAGPAAPGAKVLSVRSTTGISAGDTLQIGTGPQAETRKIVSVGTPASDPTSLWQPLPDGPITLPPGSTNVPIQSAAGFKVGDKIALGYGASAPFTDRNKEQYEIATVTAVGKQGTQAYLATEAPAGAINLKVTSVDDISVGDKIRLDIDSPGHGIETVEVTKVGSRASQTNLSEDNAAGATRFRVRRADGFNVGDHIEVGTPATRENVTVEAVQQGSPGLPAQLTVRPALKMAHGRDEWVVSPGTGIDIAAPLRFAHASNLPFSDRGTGISFKPETRFRHTSNEPVQALGSGITLDRPLAGNFGVSAVVRDERVTTAGYQGELKPDQWFGGPELVTRSLQFGRTITVAQASMVLRDSTGLVVDSLNYGGLVDPWASSGYQAESGPRSGGCFVRSPEQGSGFGNAEHRAALSRSAGRFPDGADSDNTCSDFYVQTATILPEGAEAASNVLKVANVNGFHPGEVVMIGTASDAERATIREIGTAGASALTGVVRSGSTSAAVRNVLGFEPGQSVTVGSGSSAETVLIASIHRFEAEQIVFAKPLRHTHPEGTIISGTGITLDSALTRSHAAGSAVFTDVPTPGAANRFGKPTPAMAEVE